jgi:hypothetical protein
MALDANDLQQLAAFVRQEVHQAVADIKAEPGAPVQSRESLVGVPDVAPDAGPEYWVHLANGDVITSYDSASTAVEVGGVGVPVIGRFQIPDGYEVTNDPAALANPSPVAPVTEVAQ